MVLPALVGAVVRGSIGLAKKGLGTTGLGTKKSDKKVIYFWMEPGEMDRLTTDIQNEVIENAKMQLVYQDINFTGDLSASIKAGTDGEHKTVEVTSPYAIPVEYGLAPGQHVSFDKLLIWVEKKLGIEDKVVAKGVAFKIRSKILARGIVPKRFLRKAILRLGRKNKLVTHKAI